MPAPGGGPPAGTQEGPAMVELWGQEYTPDAVRRLVGTMDQLAGIRLSTLDTGRARGMRTAELDTGSGFSVPSDWRSNSMNTLFQTST